MFQLNRCKLYQQISIIQKKIILNSFVYSFAKKRMLRISVKLSLLYTIPSCNASSLPFHAASLFAQEMVE